FAACWFIARDDAAKLRSEVAALSSANTELTHARLELSATIKELTAALAAATVSGAAPSADAGAASAPRVEAVPYGEIPFDRGRLDVLRDLLAKLETQGFHGVVKITSS